MTTSKKKQFKAHLIKYRQADMVDPIWFWVNPSTGATLSPEFVSQQEAEQWFDDVVNIHNQTYTLIERVMKGKFYTLRGKVDVGDIISSKKANDCPFEVHLDDDILIIEVLGTSIDDAKTRVEEYYEILEWID
jgi:hypothetical protein